VRAFEAKGSTAHVTGGNQPQVVITSQRPVKNPVAVDLKPMAACIGMKQSGRSTTTMEHPISAHAIRASHSFRPGTAQGGSVQIPTMVRWLLNRCHHALHTSSIRAGSALVQHPAAARQQRQGTCPAAHISHRLQSVHRPFKRLGGHIRHLPSTARSTVASSRGDPPDSSHSLSALGDAGAACGAHSVVVPVAPGKAEVPS